MKLKITRNLQRSVIGVDVDVCLWGCLFVCFVSLSLLLLGYLEFVVGYNVIDLQQCKLFLSAVFFPGSHG